MNSYITISPADIRNDKFYEDLTKLYNGEELGQDPGKYRPNGRSIFRLRKQESPLLLLHKYLQYHVRLNHSLDFSKESRENRGEILEKAKRVIGCADPCYVIT